MRVLHIVVNVLDCVTVFFFFFNDTATTEIYTLSLHDALPIYYKTIKSRAGRAVCGLSMGGGHTFGISRLYPTEFDYYGLFSAGLGIGRRMDMQQRKPLYDQMKEDATFQAQMKKLFASNPKL